MAQCSSQGCSSDCASGCGGDGTLDEALAQIERAQTLQRIRHKIVVLSGKGGVGKSTVAVNLAFSLAMSGQRVGLLDIDLHGPSIPTMLKLTGTRVDVVDGKLIPAGYEGLKVVSIGFLLEQPDSPVIWRGPAKAGFIKQMVEDVAWGELDYLVVDCPPGTGDEPLSIAQTLGQVDGAVVVTTPQDVALADVRKSVHFCRQLELPVLGVVENMSGLRCPHCGETVDLFKAGGGERMAADLAVPFLGRVPIDPQIVEAGDAGAPYVYTYSRSATAEVFTGIVERLLRACDPEPTSSGKDIAMRIAIPLAEGQLCLHFGHCEQFALIDVDPATRQITNTTLLTPPPHEPGLLPRWLHEQGATVIIAGGMGQRALGLFTEQGITVVTGAPVDSPEAIVTAYVQEALVTGGNVCDH